VPVPFLPSRLANIVTAIPDKGQPTKTATVEDNKVAIVGARTPNMRNPLFMTTAEREESLPPFLKQNVRAQMPDSRAYVVMQNGQVVYATEAEKARIACRTVWPVEGAQAARSVVEEVAKAIADAPMRGKSRRAMASLAFPTDREFAGTSRPPNPTRNFIVPRG
jgi:hypothetical protein